MPMREVVAFARDMLGVALHPRQEEALRGVADHPHTLLCLGRRSGKTLLAGIWATYNAVVRDLGATMRPGEPRYIVVVATAQDQARIAFRIIRAFFDLPALAPLVMRETADELWLATGAVVKVLPCSARSTRGLAISTVILDELAHFVDTEHGYQAGEMVYLALAPSVAQFGDLGRVIAASTPRGQRGAFWKLWQATATDPHVYRLQAPTWELNPAVPRSFLGRERQRDPEGFAQEYEASFVAGGGSFLNPSALAAAAGIAEHAHGVRVLALDPAFVRDSFAAALACRVGDSTYIEEVRTWEPPVGFGAVMDEVATWARALGPRAVVTDQFAAAPVVEELARRGVQCTALPWTAQSKAEAFAGFKARLNTGRLRLVDEGRLVRELAGLTATPTATGFRVDGERDDVATAAVLACWQLDQAGPPAALGGWDPPDPIEARLAARWQGRGPGPLFGRRW
jgi:hypothetical protein